MTELLKTVSDALAATVEGVNPGVVRVDARNRLSGTGIVWSDDGLIVTAHHIVERDDEIRIGLQDGSLVEANLVGRDPSTDLAVLRANSADLWLPTWADLDDLAVGHIVLALGRPGQDIQATMGIVSAMGKFEPEQRATRPHRRRHRGWGHSQLDYFIQTDVVMYPGFSGGPLVDASGQVRGLNTSVMRGTSLTIPTTTIQRVVDTLLQHGRMRRGYLGITSQPVALPASVQQELGQETGLLVMGVEPGSPADKGGMVLGDTVVGIDGQPVATMDDLIGSLTGDRVGNQVSVQLLRGGEIVEAQIVVGERP